MKKITLVGCGNIGSRHLQSLLSFQNPVSIDVVEPNKNSQKKAKSLIASQLKKNHHISWHSSIHNLSDTADVAIVATNSIERPKLINELLSQGNKKFLLEKMVCQSSIEYQKIISKLRQNHASAWVNANRRYFQSYHNIKQFFKKSKSFELNIFLGNSGLGTSAIHFVDLFCWLTDNNDISLDGKYLFQKIYSSKRGRLFKEFAGTIVGTTNQNSFLKISSHYNPSVPPSVIVDLYDGKNHFVLSELEEKFYSLTNHNGLSKFSFKFGHTSQLTYPIIQDIIHKGTSNLPTIEDSFKAHSELFRIFNTHINKNLHRKVSKCPIT